jgi:hypothetical protein
MFFKTFALILTNRNRNALSQLVKIDHEYNEMADTLGAYLWNPIPFWVL